MMKQMGLKMDELGDIDRVILQGPKREIVIEGAAVTSINMQDVLLVSQQTGVSMERAKAALEDAEGDLARAILMLTTG